jgi:ABC-2 type transport system ATP-binding protein
MTGEGGPSESIPTQDASRASTVVARDVVMRYGSIIALDHFSIDVPTGVVGLLGPNGAGKSTFIKTVLGLVEPQNGEITVAGLDSRKDMLMIRDRVGYMPEYDCLVEGMTGIELVSYFGMISGMSKSDSMLRSHEVLDFVGLGEERYRPISSFSTGMKQRVKLAQAIVHDPDILFLDEPTNGMDPLGREEMLELIGRIAASNKSILVSSHILQDMEKVCDHVIIINNGKTVAEGDMKDLLGQQKGRKRLIARGRTEALASYVQYLRREHEVISVSEEHGQMTVVLVTKKEGGDIFAEAVNAGVQLRSYAPDRSTLEDVFIRSV